MPWPGGRRLPAGSGPVLEAGSNSSTVIPATILLDSSRESTVFSNQYKRSWDRIQHIPDGIANFGCVGFFLFYPTSSSSRYLKKRRNSVG